MKIPALRGAWLDGLKDIACAVVVAIPVGASAVMAASESLQTAPGRCGAVERCLGLPSAPAAGSDDAFEQARWRSDR